MAVSVYVIGGGAWSSNAAQGVDARKVVVCGCNYSLSVLVYLSFIYWSHSIALYKGSYFALGMTHS